MLNETMMTELDRIASSITCVEKIEEYSFMRCDCTGGCLDNCYDCSENSGNQW